jgi:cobalt-zinc-cadmium resistance protein CzcA
MIERIVDFSIQWRRFSRIRYRLPAWEFTRRELPIDAVPDITTNQVQINALALAFTPLEIEKYVTFPIEVAMTASNGRCPLPSCSASRR